ncbi:MAG: sigma-70 family RNA polymerase sigma factor [Planctomycetes bacterium]|nr:sigma-70 family RNA polymerase sigma factor [Planctomycetota bacterium]
MERSAARDDLEHLLAHSGWARRLAVSLVGEGDADDLVQETWRLALEQPPRAASPASLRAWLRRVLASLGRESRVRRSTRAWHEERAARPEAHESGAAERAELQKRLADAVFALEAPYRTAIVLRYFDGFDAPAIAAKLGISHDAARQRVSRGLALLRERLDRAERGGRDAWTAAFAAWLEQSSAPSALAAGGSIVMGKIVGACVAVLVVAALSWWWLGGPRASAPEATDRMASATPTALDRPESVPSAQAVEHASSERVELAANPLATGTEPRAIDRERDLHGIVLDPEGRPVVGAELRVVRDEFTEISVLDLHETDRERTVAAARSDDRGEFVIPLTPGVAFGLEATANGFAPSWTSHVHAGERVVVTLAAGASVFGRVTRRSDGSPVANARVELPSRPRGELGAGRSPVTTVTAADGRYRFDGIPAGEYWLRASPEREAQPDWIVVTLVPGATRELDVVVDAGVTLKGRVVDDTTGSGIAGATVGEGWTARRSVVTEFDGSFVFEGFSTSGYYEIAVRAPGYGLSNVRVRQPDEPFPESVEVRLRRARSALGRIVDEAGAPLANAYVAAVAYQPNFEDPAASQQLDWQSTRSTADGTFRIDDVRADLVHSLHVRLDGVGALTFGFPPNEHELERIEFGDVVLPRGVLVKGRVVDEHGAAQPNAVVRLTGWNTDRDRFGAEPSYGAGFYLRERTTRTDDLGRFAFADIVAGGYAVLVLREGSHEQHNTPLAVAAGVEPAPLEIVMPSGGRITGRVVDRDGHGIVAYVSIDPEGGDGYSSGDVQTDGDGRFNAYGLTGSVYSLTVWPRSLWSDDPDEPRHGTTIVRGVAVGASDVALVVPRALALRGRVLDANGELATDVTVVAHRTGISEEGLTARRLPDGRFELWLAEGERFDVEAHAIVESGDRSRATDAVVRVSGVLGGGDDLELRLP